MFMLSNLRKTGIRFRNKPYYGEYLGAFSARDELEGVLVQYWNGNIMAQAENPWVLTQLIIRFMQELKRPVCGVVGNNDTANQLISELGFSQSNYSLDSVENLYSMRLESLSFDYGKDDRRFRFLHVTDIDIDLLTQWHKEYEIEALGRDNSAELEQRVASEVHLIKRDFDQWVLLANDEPVSMCGFNARLDEIVQVGPVWTPIAHRNKSYAKRLLAWALTRARNGGVRKAVLFTNNPAATSAYKTLGFAKIGYFRLALLAEPSYPRLTAIVTE